MQRMIESLLAPVRGKDTVRNAVAADARSRRSFKMMPLLLAAAVAAGPLCAREAASTNGAAKLSTADLFPDTVVAKGKGVEVKRSQLDEEVIRFKSQAAGRGQPISADNTEKLEQYMLNQLIQVQLLGARATPADKAEAKTEAEKRFSDAQTRLGVEELARQLKLLGTTREDLVAKWAEFGSKAIR